MPNIDDGVDEAVNNIVLERKRVRMTKDFLTGIFSKKEELN